MKSILYTQLKQLGRNKLKYIIFLLILMIEIISVINFHAYDDETCYFIQIYLFTFYTIIHIFIAIAVSDICAGDFSDKTFYYEIMSGKTRFSSYFSRVIIAVVFILIGCLLLVILPLVLCTVLCGWGDLFTVGDIAVVIAVSVAPLFRIICTYICLAFIIRNTYAVMALGMGGFMISSMTELPFFKNAPVEILGSTSILRLCTFNMWCTFGLNDVYTPVVDATIPADEIQSIIIWSVVFAAAFLLIGYSYFKHDDLN